MAILDDGHYIVDVFGVSAVIGELHGSKAHGFPEKLRIEVDGHGRTEYDTVVVKFIRNARVLAQLIVYGVAEPLQRLVVLEKGVD